MQFQEENCPTVAISRGKIAQKCNFKRIIPQKWPFQEEKLPKNVISRGKLQKRVFHEDVVKTGLLIFFSKKYKKIDFFYFFMIFLIFFIFIDFFDFFKQKL